MSYNLKNRHREVHTFEDVVNMFEKALEKSKSDDHIYIATIAKELDTYKEFFSNKIERFENVEQYPNGEGEYLRLMYKKIKSNLEANNFTHGKNATNPTFAIFNLKCNYGHVDHQKDEPNTITLKFADNSLKESIDRQLEDNGEA